MAVAPVRFAMGTASPTWSPWPWEIRMKSAWASSALIAALGLLVRKGSISRRWPSVSTSRQACPSQRTRVAMVVPPQEVVSGELPFLSPYQPDSVGPRDEAGPDVRAARAACSAGAPRAEEGGP